MKDLDGINRCSPAAHSCAAFLDTLAAGKDLYAEKTMTGPSLKRSNAGRGETTDRVVQVGLQHESSGSLAVRVSG